jgi:dihydroorotate dehydrogenase
MLYSLLRPALFSMDAERAHNLAIGGARVLANHPWLAELVHDYIARPARCERRVAGLTFPNPIGLAAGMDKNAVAPLAWWAFGFGFMELGTVTPLPQAGKPKPRMFRFPDRRAIVNRMGFNNGGVAAVAAELQRQSRLGLRPRCPIGMSVGMNAVTPREKAAEDYRIATRALAPYADYIAINVSSPNTAGLRGLQAGGEIAKIIEATRSEAGGRPLFVKIAPELDEAAVGEVVSVCVEGGAAGVIATNTLATANMAGYPEGGMSGLPLRERALHQVGVARKFVRDRMAVIGCGGIDDGASARRMLEAGADLVQLYTGLVYRGPFLPAGISRELAERRTSPAIPPHPSPLPKGEGEKATGA